MQDTIKKLTSGRRWLWIVAVVIVIGVAAFFVISASAQSQRANAQTANQTTRAQTGDISGSITASGHIQAHQDVSLTMQTSGVVEAVSVKVGDKVTRGTVLVALDDSDARRSLQSAQNALEQAKLNAESAQISYNSDAGYKPSDSSLASAIADANNAAAAVQAAQADYDRVAWNPSVSSTQQSLELAQATNNYTAAKASLDSLLSTRPDLATPKINLDVANLQVSDAEISLESAQATLDRTKLIAPFDGTITAVNVDPGETTSGVAIEIISTDQFEVSLLVDEVDMSSLEIGQPATFTLDTWPSVTLTGEVIAIDPTPTEGSNADVINYGVHLSVDKTDLPVLVGMTANATVTTFDLKGVLLVPNGAVTLGADGRYTVNLMSGGQVKQTEVVIGVHNTEYTQILSGLNEGDEVVVGALTTTETRTGGGFLFGGGGPPPGGGGGGSR